MAKALKKNDLCRFITRNIQPAYTTFNTLRRRLEPKGFIEIHKRFVRKANRLGLFDPHIKELPKHRKEEIILVADSTFVITSSSTRRQKDDQGQWNFKDSSVAFSGKGHHRHKYPVGHKAHSVRTVSGVPLVALLAPANESDQALIFPLVEELVSRYPSLRFSYMILDRCYDTEEIHHDLYEFYGIIPVIIRKRPLKNPAIFIIPKKTMDFFEVTGGRVLKRPAREHRN